MSEERKLPAEEGANLNDKDERKARAKEEYRLRMLQQEQKVLAERAKEAEREAKNEQLVKEGKEIKQEKRPSGKPSVLVRFWRKVKDVFGEAKHVTWAKPEKVFRSTIVVLAVTGAFLVIATLMDIGLGQVYKWFMGLV